MPDIVRKEQIFQGAVRFEVRPTELQSKFAAGATTPSVKNVRVWVCSGSVVTITNFLNGTKNTDIILLGDGTTTIANNANIVTNTGANVLLALNKVYRFTFINNIWCMDA